MPAPILNKPEFQPLSQVLGLSMRCLGLLEPFMKTDQPTKWPSAGIFTTITVITPWIRNLLFQLTMADPVKVMLVTEIRHQWI